MDEIILNELEAKINSKNHGGGFDNLGF